MIATLLIHRSRGSYRFLATSMNRPSYHSHKRSSPFAETSLDRSVKAATSKDFLRLPAKETSAGPPGRKGPGQMLLARSNLSVRTGRLAFRKHWPQPNRDR